MIGISTITITSTKHWTWFWYYCEITFMKLLQHELLFLKPCQCSCKSLLFIWPGLWSCDRDVSPSFITEISVPAFPRWCRKNLTFGQNYILQFLHRLCKPGHVPQQSGDVFHLNGGALWILSRRRWGQCPFPMTSGEHPWLEWEPWWNKTQ